MILAACIIIAAFILSVGIGYAAERIADAITDFADRVKDGE